ncbi:TPA: hypothetical protein L4R50_000144 [Pseudomonas aeruginosa]|nr:hypothetical protein [Pseudomonas aeruginosa]
MTPHIGATAQASFITLLLAPKYGLAGNSGHWALEDEETNVKRSSSFKSQMLGFYFSINGLRVPESRDTPEGELDAAYAINARAYQLLDQSLPKTAEWLKKDEHQPEITFTPYEVCEESVEIEEIEGCEAFSFWLYSHHQIGLDVASAFLVKVAKACEQAAAELGGVVKFLRLESVVTEEVKTTTNLVVEPVTQLA